MRSVKIFGREPAVILSVIAAAINLAAAYFLPWNQDQITAVNVVIGLLLGFGIAVFTRDSLLAIGLGLINAIFALALSFGTEIGADKQTAILVAANVILGMFNRTQTTPAGPGEHVEHDGYVTA